MGSWIETCFVSHLPIRYGDACRLFFLQRVQRWSDDAVYAGFSYPYAMWAPCSFALKGRYNDYGGVKDIALTPFETRYALAHLKERVVELEAEAEDLTRRRGGITRSDLTLESAQQDIAEGRLRFRDHQNREQVFGRVLVREDVYQALVQREWTLSWRTPEQFTVNRLVRQGRAVVAALRVLLQDRSTETEFYRQIVTSFDVQNLNFTGSKTEYDFQHFVCNNSMAFRTHLSALRRAWMP